MPLMALLASLGQYQTDLGYAQWSSHSPLAVKLNGSAIILAIACSLHMDLK